MTFGTYLEREQRYRAIAETTPTTSRTQHKLGHGMFLHQETRANHVLESEHALCPKETRFIAVDMALCDRTGRLDDSRETSFDTCCTLEQIESTTKIDTHKQP